MRVRELLITLLVSFISTRVQALACWSLYSPQAVQILLINSVLKTKNPSHYEIHRNQTIFFSGHLDSDGKMSFYAPGGLAKWISTHEARPNSDTPHGDLRNPIFIFGPELSSLLGWELQLLNTKQGLNGPIILKVPGSFVYEKLILQVNEVLVAEGKEPIAILPRKSGFLQPHEILQFSRLTPEEIEFGLAFDDRDSQLSPHEAAYHLNLIFPKELLRRARNINTLVSEFASLLKRVHLANFSHYADAIEAGRSQEVDIASGKSTTLLADYRAVMQFEKPTSEKNINAIFESATISLAQQVLNWSRPTITPFEALVQELVMYEPSFGKFLQKEKPDWMTNLSDLNGFPEKRTKGYMESQISSSDEATHRILLNLLVNFQKSSRPLLRPSLMPRRSAEWWSAHILTTLEQRVDEITSALRIALRNKSK